MFDTKRMNVIDSVLTVHGHYHHRQSPKISILIVILWKLTGFFFVEEEDARRNVHILHN